MKNDGQENDWWNEIECNAKYYMRKFKYSPIPIIPKVIFKTFQFIFGSMIKMQKKMY